MKSKKSLCNHDLRKIVTQACRSYFRLRDLEQCKQTKKVNEKGASRRRNILRKQQVQLLIPTSIWDQSWNIMGL
eukprot:scaffold2209_cov57-Attheya_sp.AAC.2